MLSTEMLDQCLWLATRCLPSAKLCGFQCKTRGSLKEALAEHAKLLEREGKCWLTGVEPDFGNLEDVCKRKGYPPLCPAQAQQQLTLPVSVPPGQGEGLFSYKNLSQPAIDKFFMKPGVPAPLPAAAMPQQ